MRTIAATLSATFVVAALLPAIGCESLPTTAAQKASLHEEVEAAIARFKARDPGLNEFFETARGYAVFPRVGKGAVGVGGAHGNGEVYAQGELIGYCALKQGTVGFQLGGQTYSEIIFFERASALARFRTGSLKFAGQASAVAVTAGASADAEYENGVAVFTLPIGGLMFEASIGGQQFTFKPK